MFNVKAYQKQIVFVGSILILFVLSGCMQAQTNLMIYGDQQWGGNQAIKYGSGMGEMMGMAESMAESMAGSMAESFGAELDGSEEMTTSTEPYDTWVKLADEAANRDDLNIMANEQPGDDGSQTYILQANGSDFGMMNELFFQNQADISVAMVNGQKQITIYYEFTNEENNQALGTDTSSEDLTPAEQSEMLKSMGIENNVRITGGEIIQSNATRVEGTTAIWDSEAIIEVTLTEAPTYLPEKVALQPFGEVANPFDTFGGDGNFDFSFNSSTGNVTNATNATTDTSGTAPVDDDQNLPSAGGIISLPSSVVPTLLAALLLVILTVGAIKNVAIRLN